MNGAWTFLLNLSAAAAIGYAGAACYLQTHVDTARAASLREAAARARSSVVTVYAGAAAPGSLTIALGSGVVVDAHGSVVTTSALAGGGGELRVALADGQLLPAHVVGSDADSGLTLLRVEGGSLRPIGMGDVQTVAVGDPVLAVGDAVGNGLAATRGIVSAVGPGQLRDQAPAKFIHTDALVHPGSLGGALVDSDGRLVGVTVGSIAAGDGTDALAAAVPVDRVQQIVARLASATRGDPVLHPERAPRRLKIAANP